jgi:VRR-NUC domain
MSKVHESARSHNNYRAIRSQAGTAATLAARTSSPPLDEGRIMSAIASHFAWRARRGIWWCHIPNGGLRSKIEASILRGQGVKPGAPDLLIVADGKAYFLEVKTEAGRVSQAQADCHEELRRAGAEVGVAFGLDEALRQLEQWHLLRGRAA